MNEEVQMKLQAYVDGELPSREAAEVEALIARDAEAKALVAELRNTAAALAGHEVGMKLPEPGDFFWSKIRGEIERASRVEAPAPKVSLAAWFWRSLIPTGALALVCGLVLRSGSIQAAPEFSPETDVASDDVGAYTYRSQESGLTTVWIYDRDQGSQFTPSGAADSVEKKL